MSDLEKRKRLLIAESDAYREVMKLEMYNLRIYGLKTKKKLTSFKTTIPVLMSGAPMAGSLFGGIFGGKKKSKLQRMIAAGLLGWQVYNRIKNFTRAAVVSRAVAEEEYEPSDTARF